MANRFGAGGHVRVEGGQPTLVGFGCVARSVYRRAVMGTKKQSAGTLEDTPTDLTNATGGINDES